MEFLLEYIEGQACSNAYVGLMSTPNMEAFYQKFGFTKRPTDGMGHGMVKFVNKRPLDNYIKEEVKHVEEADHY